MIRRVALLLAALSALALPLRAAESVPALGNQLTATLLTATDGVTGETISAALRVDLAPGWKTYWRSPGEVGLPPELDWSGSVNVADAALAYPAPTRFEAFDIQNFGYEGAVTFPLTIRVADATAPARLDVAANLLVCAEICIPETVTLTLDLPVGGGMDEGAAARIAEAVARVPGGEETGISVRNAHLDATALTIIARAETPFAVPDLFPERGPQASFGAPDIRLSDGGRTLWARLPVLSAGEGPLSVTLTDGARAATLDAPLAATAPPPPTGAASLWWMILIAALGGLILNAMPCVLPVLSIKLASALQAQDRAPARIRAGFLAAAAGVLAFFLALAAAVIALRAGGVAVGWGIQFQQPAFLALMIGLMAVFAANMFGWFEIGLGQGAQTRMAKAGGPGLGGDFATGAFAAIMATPCSAPFIGTAVTYALTHGPVEIVALFAAMGVGLAAPYLLVAARPGLVRRLPRPGRWMGTVRAVLGGLLLLTALWLLSVLWASAGMRVAFATGFVAALLLGALALRLRPTLVGATGVAALVATALLLPPAPASAVADGPWRPFDRAGIAPAVAAGEVVFVDVTADWCLTCKANKRLVLDSADVAETLSSTVRMRADWTRPDPAIAAYLREHDRFGIPFNAVYGPGAPGGIALPELLTEAAVLDAIAAARN